MAHFVAFLINFQKIIPSKIPPWGTGVIGGSRTISICDVELRCCFFPAESKDCMDSASYEYRNMSAMRGAHLMPIGMPTIRLKKNFPPKTTKLLSATNSIMLIMSSSVYLLFKSECSNKCRANQALHHLSVFQRNIKRDFYSDEYTILIGFY